MLYSGSDAGSRRYGGACHITRQLDVQARDMALQDAQIHDEASFRLRQAVSPLSAAGDRKQYDVW